MNKHIRGLEDEIEVEVGNDDADNGQSAPSAVNAISIDEASAAHVAALNDLQLLQEEGMLPVIPTKRQKNAALGLKDPRDRHKRMSGPHGSGVGTGDVDLTVS